jgi:ankyrin repeat protein
MDSKSSTKLRSRHREASQKGRILDVTDLDDNGNGTKIIPEYKLTEDHIGSLEFYIASRNKSSFDKATNALKNLSSRVKSPVPQRSRVNKQEVVHVVTVEDLDSIMDDIRMKIRKIKYIGPSDDICKLTNFPNIEYLEDAGVNNNQFIISASKYGCLEVVKFLTSLDSVDPGAQDNQAIIAASEYGHLEVVKFLSALDSVDPEDQDYKAIDIAIEHGHSAVATFLIDKIYYIDDEIISIFSHLAIKFNNISVLRYLITLLDEDEVPSFLEYAIYNNKLEIVKFLVKYVDDIHIDSFLKLSIMDGNLDIFRILFESYSEKQLHSFHYTKMAIKLGKVDIAIYLLSVTDFAGDTEKYTSLVRKTIKYDRLDILKYMDELFDHPYIHSSYVMDDQTIHPLYFAAYASSVGNLEIVKYLSTLDTASSIGLTKAFDVAIIFGHLEIVKYLSGLAMVDMFHDNNEGLRLANEYGHNDIAEFLSGDIDCSTVDSEELCDVCFSENVNMKYNPCSHLICKKCIVSWRITSETCPFCRTNVLKR